MATLLGHLGEFCPDKEEWTHYELRLKHYFVANEIEDASKQKSVFLTCIGSVAFKQLTSLIAPASVDEKTLKDLKEVLQKYYVRCLRRWSSATISIQEFRSLVSLLQPM